MNCDLETMRSVSLPLRSSNSTRSIDSKGTWPKLKKKTHIIGVNPNNLSRVGALIPGAPDQRSKTLSSSSRSKFSPNASASSKTLSSSSSEISSRYFMSASPRYKHGHQVSAPLCRSRWESQLSRRKVSLSTGKTLDLWDNLHVLLSPHW